MKVYQRWKGCFVQMSETESQEARAIRLRGTIIDAISDAIIIYNSGGSVIQMNKAARELIGLQDSQEYMATSPEQHAEQLRVRDEYGRGIPREQWIISRLLNGEVLSGPGSLDMQFRALDGREKLVNVGGAPLYDEQGNVTGAVLISRDVTERRHMERQIRVLAEESQGRARHLEAIIEAMVDGVFVYDGQGTIVQMNTAALQMLGLRNKEEFAVLSPEERLSLLRVCDENGFPFPHEQWGVYRILKGETLTGEDRIRVILHTLDGREIHASIGGAPLYDERGNIIGAVAVTSDTTRSWKLEKRITALAAEAQTRASHLKTVIESMAEAVMVYDKESMPVQMNKAAQQMLGLDNDTAARFFDSPLKQFLTYFEMRDEHGKELSAGELSAARALKGEVVRGRELHIIRHDGSKVVILSSAAPIYTEDGQITGAVVVAQDITQRKSIEQQKSEFLSIASHELRTPITSIQGFAEILQVMVEKGELVVPPRCKYALKEIVLQSGHLTRLIQEMLDLSRIENDQMLLRLAPYNLLETLVRVKESRSLVNKHHDIQLVLDGLEPGTPLMGVFDQDRIEQVLNNLLDNAAKYSPAGSKIEVGLRCRAPEQALIWVKDEGIGIAPDELPHIFERFRRASNFDASISGFGIGLYLVREFVVRHNGRVWAESIENQGSTFYVWLPLNK